MKTLHVIGGPTASGKTALAIKWAKKYNTEILSADSRQCYIELNIGVAKPTHDELKSVPHHFINSHSIHEHVTAGDYERYGLDVLETLFKTKNDVIVVGGTGLYIKALCEGIDEMPPISSEIKNEIENQYKANGLHWLKEEVKKHDPFFFAMAEQENPARLMRALIFKHSTQHSISEFRRKKAKPRSFEIKYYAIKPDRQTLYNQINARVDKMIDDGLEDEVVQLKPFLHLKNLQTVGYQEWLPFFQNQISKQEVAEKIKQHTRNYAKRQMTWFSNQGDYMLI